MALNPGDTPGQAIRFVGDRFQVERVAFDVRGKRQERDVIRHHGSVVMVPLLPERRVCLIKNFRASVLRHLIELPAGTLDPGEPPQQAAFRELEEETGFQATAMHHIKSFYAAPGILDECMHIYVATGLTPGTPRLEANEIIDNLIVPWAEAIQMIAAGQIEDGKTMVGLLFVEQFLLKNGWPDEAR